MERRTEKRERKEGKKVRKFRVRKWEIRVHDNGVVEFVGLKRVLMIPISISDEEIAVTLEALPSFVLAHFLTLIEKGII